MAPLPAMSNATEEVSLVGTKNLVESSHSPAIYQMAKGFFELVVTDAPFNILVNKILANLIAATGANAGSVLELDNVKSEFFFRASKGGGDTEKLKSFRVPANKGIVGHVYESKQVILINDMDGDKMQLKAVSMSTGFEIKSCLAAPIVVANNVYGVIELFNKKGSNYFNEADKRLLMDGLKMAEKVLEVRFLTAELFRRGRK